MRMWPDAMLCLHLSVYVCLCCQHNVEKKNKMHDMQHQKNKTDEIKMAIEMPSMWDREEKRLFQHTTCIDGCLVHTFAALTQKIIGSLPVSLCVYILRFNTSRSTSWLESALIQFHVVQGNEWARAHTHQHTHKHIQSEMSSCKLNLVHVVKFSLHHMYHWQTDSLLSGSTK